MTLDKGGRRRTDAYNEVRLLFSEERAEIRDERNLRVFIAGTGRHKRMVSDVELPRRLPLQLASNGSGIFAPGLEVLTKRMQEQDPLGVGRSRLQRREQKKSDRRQPNSVRPLHPQNPPAPLGSPSWPYADCTYACLYLIPPKWKYKKPPVR